ncbi:10609_t:CDS:2 [Funneliformis geosporum]|uniref:10609_t:CDS:1 n=1 Tax=Funneliformis geosporum TaxID=1117311 RepID=A0A9W4WTP4_9GLOM|nr:10609_t:CDS:2 [Funneliformis geosporum]
MECKLVSENGQELGCNEFGELYVREPNVMKGYLNNKEDTDICIDSDGWFRTGDEVFADSRELIKYKGYQVAPAELESVLLTHPSVTDAAVIGVHSNESATEYPAAYVVLQKDIIQSDEIKEEIKTFVSQRVPNHLAVFILLIKFLKVPLVKF